MNNKLFCFLSLVLILLCVTSCTSSLSTISATSSLANDTVPLEEPFIDDGSFFCRLIPEGQDVSFDRAPKAFIDIYKWSNEYTPVSYAQMVYRENDGFYIRMHCEEANPKATFTEFSDDVYLDSCLEFFCDYSPSTFTEYYINTEMNANGAFFCSWAHGIGKYEEIRNISDSFVDVTAFRDETGWGVNLYVPLEMLNDLYPNITWGNGSVIRVNFYKCGSGCDIPHYGIWNLVDLEHPNFHTPEFFKEVEIK